MTYENSWKQNQFPLSPTGPPSPTVFNYNNSYVSFLHQPVLKNQFRAIQSLPSSNNDILLNDNSTIQRTLSACRQLRGIEPKAIQGPNPLENHAFANGPSIPPNSNSFQHQLPLNNIKVSNVFYPPIDQMLAHKANGIEFPLCHSTEGNRMMQNLQQVKYQFPANASNIPQNLLFPTHQLPPKGISMHQNSNMLNQQLPMSEPHTKYIPPHVLSQSEFGIEQARYPPNLQSETEVEVRQGLHSLFGNHSTNGLGLHQNQCIPSQRNQNILYPDIPEIKPNIYNILTDRSLNKSLFSVYSEKVHICVVGPPWCGKSDLIRTFANGIDVRIPTDKPLSCVFRPKMTDFGTTLKIDVWYGEDLASFADDLRSLCESSKCAIVLVYSVTQNGTLSTVMEWIKVFKKDIAIKVPIILIGNTDGVSREFSKITSDLLPSNDNIRAAKYEYEYDLALFHECSVKSAPDVEHIFLVAVFKAFCRTVQKSVLF